MEKLHYFIFILIFLGCKKDRLSTDYLYFKNNTDQNVTALIFNGYDSNKLYRNFVIEPQGYLIADTVKILHHQDGSSNKTAIQGEKFWLGFPYWHSLGFRLIFLFDDGRATAYPKDISGTLSGGCDTADLSRTYPCNFAIQEKSYKKFLIKYSQEEITNTTFYITNQEYVLSQ